MILQVGGLPEGHHTFSDSVPCENLDLPAAEFPGDAHLVAVVGRHGQNLHIKLRCAAEAHLECDRCLSAFVMPIDGEMRLVYSENVDIVKDEDDEFLRLLPHNGEIDLRDDARQTIMLQIPMQILCQENCKGLCSQCGANLNQEQCDCTSDRIDPRWEQLRELRFR
jgi:uncharacterized protein